MALRRRKRHGAILIIATIFPINDSNIAIEMEMLNGSEELEVRNDIVGRIVQLCN